MMVVQNSLYFLFHYLFQKKTWWWYYKFFTSWYKNTTKSINYINNINKTILLSLYVMGNRSNHLIQCRKLLKAMYHVSPIITRQTNIVRRKNRVWQLHCQTLGNRYECQESSEMTIINAFPVSRKPHCSMAMSAEYRSKSEALNH